MEADESLVPDAEAGISGYEAEGFRHHVDQIVLRVNQLEQRVEEVEQFYDEKSKKPVSASKGNPLVKDEKPSAPIKKLQQVNSHKETDGGKRMQELMNQFGTILRQITLHKWAWPFMEPVDVQGLGLHDYHEVIEKPMDFSTIKNRMEAKDNTGYKNVREICADVRLVFKNAMRYNDEKNDVHVMAKTLLAKFEEKWLHLLPKVTEEERRQEQEAAAVLVDMQLAKEAAHAKMVRDICSELSEVEMHLEELRKSVLAKCRKFSIFEKIQLADDLPKLPVEEVNKAMEIVARHNPGFQFTVEDSNIDLDSQSDSVLWSLKFFVKNALELQRKNLATASDVNMNRENNKNSNRNTNSNKRKKEICDALAKSSRKKNTTTTKPS